ncbi:MAG: HlyD family efflux transporter periplasmic adaptor subunit [Clostridiales bacterium]|nr:HlyD family efflux transporter periplasmic adaptor subunit [Clostridiales bacterium]
MKLFRNKTIYIVLIIVCTMLLIADLVIRFEVPSLSVSSDYGVFYALADAVCVVLLLHNLKRQKSASAKAPSASQDAEGSIDDRPIRKKPLWLLLLVPVLVAAIVLKTLPKAEKEEQSSMSVKEQVLSAQAEKKKITTVYLGGGTLTEETATAVLLPGAVRIDSYAVENGEMVSTGDLIATVNKSSVLSLIRQVQSAISDIDEKLSEELSEEETDKIISSADGRVMAVYAEEGCAVTDTISENGALLLLSLDGLLCTQIPAGDLDAGDSVIVTLPDGTEEKGHVISVLEDVATITVSDENVSLEDQVTIKNETAEVLATCRLSVNSALKVLAYRGITENIVVEPGEMVVKGDVLLSLRNNERSSEYTWLSEQREELSAQMEELFSLYDSGEIRAVSEGEICGLNEDILLNDAVSVKESENETGAVNVSSWGSDEDSAKAVTLSAIMYIKPESGRSPDQDGDNSKQDDSEQPSDQTETSDPAVSDQSSDQTETSDPPASDQPSDQTEASDPPASDQPSDQSQISDQQITDNSKDTSGQSSGKEEKSSGEEGSAEGEEGENAKGEEKSSGKGDGSGMKGASSESKDQSSAKQETEKESEAEKQESYALSECEIYSIAPREVMTIDITVDELDIRTLHVGDKAVVTLDAIPGQSFDGEIISIGEEGTYDSGNTKYQITVSVPRTKQMYNGMNAGIRVTVCEEEYLTVPVAALIEENGNTYVYTLYDEEEERFDGLTEVVTGVSDGTDVQIVSGLSEGDTVCYRYADSIELTFIRHV